jgi:hypothetical protein
MADEPEAEERERRRSWWQTMPGLITAFAGLLTAITGLVVAVNELGLLSGDDDAPTTVATSGQPRATTVPEEPDAGASYRATFPGARMATIGDHSYELMGAQVLPHNPGELSLRLSVRMTNNSEFDANFWDRSFPLLVDGAARAPTGGLNELVAGRSEGEGTVVFVVPESARDLTLLVGATDAEAVRLPIALRPV